MYLLHCTLQKFAPLTGKTTQVLHLAIWPKRPLLCVILIISAVKNNYIYSSDYQGCVNLAWELVLPIISMMSHKVKVPKLFAIYYQYTVPETDLFNVLYAIACAHENRCIAC